MRYINATVDFFATYLLNTNKKLILFGAGAVCKTFVPYIADKYGLSHRIEYVIDNNPSKQGYYICFNQYSIPVVKVDILHDYKEDYVILITNGDFYSVITQLNQIEECSDTYGFITAFMQLDREYDKSLNHIYKDYAESMIPKIIHYCWFSENPMPVSFQKCIETWKEKCPDYEIIQWDERSFDVNKYRYTKEAYELQKWSFIPDIVRLEKLYEMGGFYFDTDVEIIKNIDELRYQEAFCGRERAGHVNFGGGSGCIKGCVLVKEILDFRKDEPFKFESGGFNSEASGYYETTPLIKRGLKIEDINQKLDGINIYASEFFSPYNYINGDNIQNENTFSIHYFSGSWIEEGDRLRKETREKYLSVKSSLEFISL